MPAEFDHVYWLGGSPCAGKSSIAHQLAAQLDLTLYHGDTEFERQRDAAFARWIQRETAVRQMACLLVDGSHTIAQNCRQVAATFGLISI